MTENERRLRTWCESAGGMARILDEVLAEARDVARAEALEEAAAHLSDLAQKYPRGTLSYALLTDAANSIRALTTTSAPASIPVERVREVLVGLGCEATHLNEPPRTASGWTLKEVARRLGVPLDTAQEDEAAISRGEHQQVYWTGKGKP